MGESQMRQEANYWRLVDILDQTCVYVSGRNFSDK